jgi:hypothetical protein
MKKTKAHRGLHLVTAEEAAARCQQDPKPSSQQERDSLIANGMRRYQELQAEVDRELFGTQDRDKLAVLLPDLQLLRQRLASYGVHV